LLPYGEWIFPEYQVTERSERFLSAEIVREKLVRRLGKVFLQLWVKEGWHDSEQALQQLGYLDK